MKKQIDDEYAHIAQFVERQKELMARLKATGEKLPDRLLRWKDSAIYLCELRKFVEDTERRTKLRDQSS